MDSMDSGDEGTQYSGSSEEYDKNLPATHSYLPGGMTSIRGRSVLDAGWQGTIPCWCHHSIVFPGESVPMHCPNLTDYQPGLEIVQEGRLFGLICPDGEGMSNYGVLCEVMETTDPYYSDDLEITKLSFKAQARQRFCLNQNREGQSSLRINAFVSNCQIKILPDVILHDPLSECRFFSQRRRNMKPSMRLKLRKADSMLTPWPYFVYDIFDLNTIVTSIKEYFKEWALENLPDDILSLSYWVASNLTIPKKERLELFKIDNALLRLHMELKYLYRNQILCCVMCKAQITNMENIFPMSNEGLHSNYCNVGGYVHDVVTVRDTINVDLQGDPSMEFTWFPGYYWTIGVCSICRSHMGWRFSATKESMRPQEFWGLTRNSITTRNAITE